MEVDAQTSAAAAAAGDELRSLLSATLSPDKAQVDAATEGLSRIAAAADPRFPVALLAIAAGTRPFLFVAVLVAFPCQVLPCSISAKACGFLLLLGNLSSGSLDCNLLLICGVLTVFLESGTPRKKWKLFGQITSVCLAILNCHTQHPKSNSWFAKLQSASAGDCLCTCKNIIWEMVVALSMEMNILMFLYQFAILYRKMEVS